jgi:hypothetical protein
MSVWETSNETWLRRTERSEARRETELRLSNSAAYFSGKPKTWNDQAPCVRGVSKHDRPVPATIAQSLEKLRRTWNNGLQRVATGLRVFLGGYGYDISTRKGLGSQGQQCGVLQGELPVGHAKGERPEQAEQSRYGRKHNGCGNGHLAVDAVLPAETGIASDGTSGQAESYPVYDILNAGPQQRFVVLGNHGPFIVHNCVQHLARYVISDAMLEMKRRTGRNPALSVHDELVYVVDEDDAQDTLDTLQEIMRTPPSWWPELITWSEGSYGDTYGAVK